MMIIGSLIMCLKLYNYYDILTNISNFLNQNLDVYFTTTKSNTRDKIILTYVINRFS